MPPSPPSPLFFLHLLSAMDSTAALFLFLLAYCTDAQMPGFTSIDCGGITNFTDELGLHWISDNQFPFGESLNVSVVNEMRNQYTTLRKFPADSRKYCYTLNVISRSRYLLRATFLYGNFDNNNVYPKFDVSVGATHWSSIVISDANTVEVRELIFLATSPTVSLCLSNATTGQPFISTLEIRQFNDSMYYTASENEFYLGVSARINFGSQSEEPVRYPDDPFDRIWESDSIKKANYLVDVAAGTTKVFTKKPIKVDRSERPPQKVMQTAVVGMNGSLTYRLNLNGFPGFGWAFTYFAEIEELSPNETRKFRLILPGMPDLSKPVVDIQENAQGKYSLYEPGYENLSFPFVLSFRFGKTSDSSKGPLLNAMEINKYIKKTEGSVDGDVVGGFISKHSEALWALEGGDPCLPVPWSWLVCNADQQPRIASIKLSMKNLTGNIPLEFTKFSGLFEIWLDGNLLTGAIPDFSGCISLRIIHLEDNHLTGGLPSSLQNLPALRELYVQNNMLSGTVPSVLLNRNIIFNYSGNIDLRKGSRNHHTKIIIGSAVVCAFVFILAISCIFMHKEKKKFHKKDDHRSESPKRATTLGNVGAEAAHFFKLSEIRDATRNFEKKIGSGGFGVVYHGKIDGKEIAVKVLSSNSFQGKREFINEVTLLSRIHHRNLVQFIGYCQEEGRCMLVYEFMHNGTLKEHLYGPLLHDRSINWIKRLEIAEDAARGIEYLHTGCVPAVIHRDLKSSNILVDRHMKAKVSDFGLSKLAVDGASHVSSIVRGTVGYLDPEYYLSQRLTEKSDVYSFGVILLELLSGRQPISNESFGVQFRNIVQWAKWHIESGDIQGIIDPSLGDEYDVQSVWKIAENALMCVQAHGSVRPSISDIIKDIQDALSIERSAPADVCHTHDMSSSINMPSMDMVAVAATADNYLSLDDSLTQPPAR